VPLEMGRGAQPCGCAPPCFSSAHYGPLVSRAGRRVVLFASAFVAACFTTFLPFYSALSQDALFNPSTEEKRREEEPEEKPQGSVVLSFARFEPQMRSLCAEMEADLRRARLLALAQARVKNTQDCPSCRALWRSVVSACRQGSSDKKKSSQKVSNKKKPLDPANDGESSTPTLEPTPTPAVPARYPSTAAVDAASRLSNKMYEQDPLGGGVYEALGYLSKTLTGLSDLTPAEKDYFGILTTYLVSAWQGRLASEESSDAASGSNPSKRSGKASKREQLDSIFE
jgi:hypothetical protein